MNERIKETTAPLLDEVIRPIADGIKDIYIDGYDTALRHVKRELERFIREKCCPGYSGINVCRDMIKFIDKLTE